MLNLEQCNGNPLIKPFIKALKNQRLYHSPVYKMWLLHTTTFTLQNFYSVPPDYVILSHAWGEEEITFEEMSTKQTRFEWKHGYQKISGSCRQAVKDGFQWIWIDTCCIDKRSSAELSEAINSMYNWYWNAVICYVYLEDIQDVKGAQFGRSRWFHRGWTLQELLAPGVVEFYTRAWVFMGSKDRYAEHIQGVTKIDCKYIQDRNTIKSACIATKFGWASERSTSRTEDLAYCLLGLVQVNMPMLYGEGERAFQRLQLEILKQSNDHTIFAWQFHDTLSSKELGILAPSPLCFKDSMQYRPSESPRTAEELTYEVTNNGLRITLPCFSFNDRSGFLIRLHCVDELQRPVDIYIEPSGNEQYYRQPRISTIEAEDLECWQTKPLYLHVEAKTVEPQAVAPLFKIVDFQTARGYQVNGVSVSTLSKLTVLKRMYDSGCHINADVGADQTAYVLNELRVRNDQVACVRMNSKQWLPSHLAVIFGLYHGQPVVRGIISLENALSTNWYRSIRGERASQSTPVKDHIRIFHGNKVIMITTRKLQKKAEIVWELRIKAFECICRSQPRCNCDFLADPPDTWPDEDHERPLALQSWRDSVSNSFLKRAGKKKRQKGKPQNACHALECTCYSCEKESKIEVRPLYCEDEVCRDCLRSKMVAKSAA